MAFAGCVASDDGGGGGAVADYGGAFDAAQSFRLEYSERDCLASGPLFHVDRDRVQSFLPAGFVAEPAPSTYARLARVGTGLPPGVEAASLSERVIVISEVHACRSDVGGMQGAGWLWVSIRPPESSEGLAPAGFDLFEVCYAGGSHALGGGDAVAVAMRQAMGQRWCGDTIDAAEAVHGPLGWDWGAEILEGGSASWSFSFQDAGEPHLNAPGLYRIWLATDTAVASIDLQHVYGTAQESKIMYSVDFDCSMVVASIPAQVTGVTSCEEAKATGLVPISGLLGPHDMQVTVAYQPRHG